MHTNGGYFDIKQKAQFRRCEVWYNPNGIANILSLARVSDQYRITMDTEEENALLVDLMEQHVMKFSRTTHRSICP